jgi:phosphoglucomutase
MELHPLAGEKAPKSILINVPRVVSAYYTEHPNVTESDQSVAFGTSGHRGISLDKSFNEDHILAIVQAICDIRIEMNINGPLFLGKDTHALSDPAHTTALEVLAANEMEVIIQKDDGFTPTPVISHAIVTYNKNRKFGLSDGIVITPSHNPPDNGGIKYNSVKGGSADTQTTQLIADKANEILKSRNKVVKRIPYEKAIKSSNVINFDYIKPYVEDLDNVIDIKSIKSAGIKIGADAMGGSGKEYWDVIAKRYGLKIEVKNKIYDPTFSFMSVDKDGRIRMDCSSPYAMTNLIVLKERYDIAFGNDPDFDRHGIVSPSSGLMNSNDYLAVSIWYLFSHRNKWNKDMMIGKTLVSSSMIDKVANHLGIKLYEVPVGIKWFVDDLIEGKFAFCGEESAGALFVRKDGKVWTTDKDGIIMSLLSAEITAVTRRDPSENYKILEGMFGSAIYERIDVDTTQSEKEVLRKLSPDNIFTDQLAGEKIIHILTVAPGNRVRIGGVKVITKNGWFAARPSGTEDIYKIYAESFKGKEHLAQIQEEAQSIVNQALKESSI